MIQRLALYTALGLLLSAVQIQFDHWAFWCVVGLFWASEHLTRMETLQQVEDYVNTVKKQAQQLLAAAQAVQEQIDKKDV